MKKQVAMLVKKEMNQRRLSYGELAVMMGVSKSVVHRIVHEGNYTLETLMLVCDVLDLEISITSKPISIK